MYGRHALATCRWQWYISDQNTVTKYQPLQSALPIHRVSHSLFTLSMSYAITSLLFLYMFPALIDDGAHMIIRQRIKHGFALASAGHQLCLF